MHRGVGSCKEVFVTSRMQLNMPIIKTGSNHRTFNPVRNIDAKSESHVRTPS
jgi:hypothetical protein